MDIKRILIISLCFIMQLYAIGYARLESNDSNLSSWSGNAGGVKKTITELFGSALFQAGGGKLEEVQAEVRAVVTDLISKEVDGSNVTQLIILRVIAALAQQIMLERYDQDNEAYRTEYRAYATDMKETLTALGFTTDALLIISPGLIPTEGADEVIIDNCIWPSNSFNPAHSIFSLVLTSGQRVLFDVAKKNVLLNLDDVAHEYKSTGATSYVNVDYQVREVVRQSDYQPIFGVPEYKELLLRLQGVLAREELKKQVRENINMFRVQDNFGYFYQEKVLKCIAGIARDILLARTQSKRVEYRGNGALFAAELKHSLACFGFNKMSLLSLRHDPAVLEEDIDIDEFVMDGQYPDRHVVIRVSFGRQADFIFDVAMNPALGRYGALKTRYYGYKEDSMIHYYDVLRFVDFVMQNHPIFGEQELRFLLFELRKLWFKEMGYGKIEYWGELQSFTSA